MKLDCDFENIDLGYNDSIPDNCDYWDLDDQTDDFSSQGQLAPFTVIQLNIRGLVGKQDRLRSLLRQIKGNCKVHAMLFAETWMKKTQAKRITVPGFQYYGSYRNGKRGRGTGILLSKQLISRERKDLSLHLPNFENTTVEIKTNYDSIYLLSLYRPPNSSEKEFLKNYKQLLTRFTRAQQERLLIGLDHNMDFLKYDKHLPTKEFIELNLDLNLLPVITKPTRVTRSSATLIDNVIIGKYLQNSYDSKILISDISDHFPCIVKMYLPFSTSIKNP